MDQTRVYGSMCVWEWIGLWVEGYGTKIMKIVWSYEEFSNNVRNPGHQLLISWKGLCLLSKDYLFKNW